MNKEQFKKSEQQRHSENQLRNLTDPSPRYLKKKEQRVKRLAKWRTQHAASVESLSKIHDRNTLKKVKAKVKAFEKKIFKLSRLLEKQDKREKAANTK